MSDITEKEFSGGHGLKTSPVAGFGRSPHKFKAIFMVPVLCASSAVHPDADNHSEERIPLSGVDAHIMKMVVI